ncbi:hypothetical protein C8J56DRAFT_1166763, partial [Mycena floridula]
MAPRREIDLVKPPGRVALFLPNPVSYLTSIDDTPKEPPTPRLGSTTLPEVDDARPTNSFREIDECISDLSDPQLHELNQHSPTSNVYSILPLATVSAISSLESTLPLLEEAGQREGLGCRQFTPDTYLFHSPEISNSIVVYLRLLASGAAQSQLILFALRLVHLLQSHTEGMFGCFQDPLNTHILAFTFPAAGIELNDAPFRDYHLVDASCTTWRSIEGQCSLDQMLSCPISLFG